MHCHLNWLTQYQLDSSLMTLRARMCYAIEHGSVIFRFFMSKFRCETHVNFPVQRVKHNYGIPEVIRAVGGRACISAIEYNKSAWVVRG